MRRIIPLTVPHRVTQRPKILPTIRYVHDLQSKKEELAALKKKHTNQGQTQDHDHDSHSEDELSEDEGPYVNPVTGEIGGPRGPEPTRYGDWEKGGRVSDF